VGLTAAKLGDGTQLLFRGVHHLKATFYANYLADELRAAFWSRCLVSGGHTSLIYVVIVVITKLGETP